MLYVFTPQGRVLETHPILLTADSDEDEEALFPGGIVTNCTFGGKGLTTLYVTAGGCLYQAETDRRGA